MAEDLVIDSVYELHEKIGEGGMAAVYRATVDLDRFDYNLLYAYTQVHGETHAERRRKAEEFAKELAGKDLDVSTVRAILETHRIPLPQETVAVKVSKGVGDQARFESEWKLLLCLNHDNVIKVYGGGVHLGRHYYAMEFLKDIVSPQRVVQEFSLHRKLETFIQGGKGLAYLHANGIVHRDVKPDNMVTCLVGPSAGPSVGQSTSRPVGQSLQDDTVTGRPADSPTGRHYVTKITDLGLAKNLDDSLGLTMSQALMGTPYYMSPEQIKSAKHVDSRTDIYSLGASLYRMMTGVPPYHDKTTIYEIIKAVSQGEQPIPVQEHTPILPEAISAIIACAMALDVEARYQTMEEMVEDLETYVARETPSLLAVTCVDEKSASLSIDFRDSGLYHFEERSRTATMKATATIADTQVDATPDRRPWLAAVLIALVFGGLVYLSGILEPATKPPEPRPPAQPTPTPTPDPNPPPKALNEEERRAQYLALVRSTRAFLAAASPTSLDPQTLTKAQQALHLAKTKEEALEAEALVREVETTAARVQKERDYMRLLAAGMKASSSGHYADAIKALEQAAALKNTEEAKNALFIAGRKRQLQDTYAQALAQAQAAHKKGDWPASQAAYLAALRVEGYAEDAEAIKGLRAMREAWFAATMAVAKDAFAAGNWPQAANAYEQALSVPGFENDKKAHFSLDVARRRQREAANQAAYEKAMAEGKAFLAKKQYGKATAAFQRALQVEGYEKDFEATQNLKIAQEQKP